MEEPACLKWGNVNQLGHVLGLPYTGKPEILPCSRHKGRKHVIESVTSEWLLAFGIGLEGHIRVDPLMEYWAGFRRMRNRNLLLPYLFSNFPLFSQFSALGDLTESKWKWLIMWWNQRLDLIPMSIEKGQKVSAHFGQHNLWSEQASEKWHYVWCAAKLPWDLMYFFRTSTTFETFLLNKRSKFVKGISKSLPQILHPYKEISRSLPQIGTRSPNLRLVNASCLSQLPVPGNANLSSVAVAGKERKCISDLWAITTTLYTWCT